MIPPLRHILKVGKTRFGKSQDELRDIIEAAKSGVCAIAVEDPHGSLATAVLLRLSELNLLHRVIYDRIADTSLVPIYEWLKPSSSPDPLQAWAENDDAIRKFIQVLIRRGGQKDTAATPMIEKGLLDALRLYIYQDKPVPLHWLARVYTPMSPEYFWMVQHCTDQDTATQFKRLALLNPSQRNAEVGPAERRLRALLMLPCFQVRCGEPSFDFDTFLEQKGILLLDGLGANPDAVSVMMSAITWRIIDFAKRRQSHVRVVIDEAINSGLVGVQESTSLAETLKWKLEFRVLVQQLNFTTDEIRANLMQNTDHVWFRQGSPEAAQIAAEDIATPVLDPMLVHHYDSHIRTVDDGYETVRTNSHNHVKDHFGRTISKSHSHNEALRRKTKEIEEQQARYTSLNDQVLLIKQQVMNLEPGWRFEKGHSSPTYRDMEMSLCDRLGNSFLGGKIRPDILERMKQAKLQKAIEKVKSSGAYRKPVLTQPPSTQPTPTQARKSGMK